MAAAVAAAAAVVAAVAMAVEAMEEQGRKTKDKKVLFVHQTPPSILNPPPLLS